jgi:hypothetical protein
LRLPSVSEAMAVRHRIALDTRTGPGYLWGMTNTKQMWKFQTVDCTDASGLHLGKPTDARGLRLRAQCGYGWVNMGDGWLQIAVAIRKVEFAERMAALTMAA